MGDVAPFLAMDRTTLTAALKPLAPRGLVAVVPDKKDARARRLTLTEDGRTLLAEVLPVWREEHDRVGAVLLALEGAFDLDTLRDGIGLIGALGEVCETDRAGTPASTDVVASAERAQATTDQGDAR